MSGFWIWLVLAAIFFAAEMMTTGFVLMWFGVGALAAALLAVTNVGGFGLQTGIFLFISIALTIASRTIFDRFLPSRAGGPELKTGMDTLPGQVGTVVEASSAESGEAAVRVFGSVWRAFPAQDEEPLRKGEQVKVERIEGVSVFVRRMGREPSWREGTGQSEGKPRQLSE
jgi:membrane protein implicated in regulation of membrane protease activity